MMTQAEWWMKQCQANETSLLLEVRQLRKEVEQLNKEAASLLHRERMANEHYRRAYALEEARIRQKITSELSSDPLFRGLVNFIVNDEIRNHISR